MSLGSIIERLFNRPAPPERSRQDAEVEHLTVRSASTLRRAERLVRLARVDAEMAAQTARQRVPR